MQLLCRPLDNPEPATFLHPQKIQYRVFVALAEQDQFLLGSDGRHKVERPGSGQLNQAIAFDMGWVGYVKDRQSSTLLLLYVKNCSAVERLVEQHRCAGLPGQFWKIRGRHDNDIVGGIGVNDRHRYDPTCNNRQRRSPKPLRKLAHCVIGHRILLRAVVIGFVRR